MIRSMPLHTPTPRPTLGASTRARRAYLARWYARDARIGAQMRVRVADKDLRDAKRTLETWELAIALEATYSPTMAREVAFDVARRPAAPRAQVVAAPLRQRGRGKRPQGAVGALAVKEARTPDGRLIVALDATSRGARGNGTPTRAGAGPISEIDRGAYRPGAEQVQRARALLSAVWASPTPEKSVVSAGERAPERDIARECADVTSAAASRDSAASLDAFRERLSRRVRLGEVLPLRTTTDNLGTTWYVLPVETLRLHTTPVRLAQ